MNFNKKAFTLSCKTFSSDSSQAKLTQPPAQSSQTKFRSRAAHSYGFTLAETLIVLVILGVVAAITIPVLVNRHVEAERRTKYRKAMSVYESALNKMVIENNIKSDTGIINWAEEDCSNTSAYFKSAQNLEEDGNETLCKFRASDGVFWDISDIKRPIVALREQDLNEETANSDTNRAFYMFGWIDEQGSLRVDDLGKITGDDKVALIKLYDFINGKTTTSNAEIPEIKYSKPCPNECDIMGYMGGGSSGCNGCSYEFDIGVRHAKALFDENGNPYKVDYTAPDVIINGETISYKGVINSDLSYTLKGYYPTGEVYEVYNCSLIDMKDLESCASNDCGHFYNKNGSVINQVGNCED